MTERGTAPLILTLGMDGESFARFDALRRQHFPPERNFIPAHITLFHALPGERRREIDAELGLAARRQKPFSLSVGGPKSLGRGVAILLESPVLHGLRRDLASAFGDWLTPQDRQGYWPHVTVQNKVSPPTARELFLALQSAPPLPPVRAEGLQLWAYLGGPWRSLRMWRFGG